MEGPVSYIGIDPGLSGGIAVIGDDGIANAIPMPTTDRDILTALLKQDMSRFAMLERVHSMPGQGVASTFKFGQNFGALRMALIAAGTPFETVLPQAWQREFGLVFPKKRGLTGTQKKNLHKARAQELFPTLTITHATADALLIAEYCRRIRD